MESQAARICDQPRPPASVSFRLMASLSTARSVGQNQDAAGTVKGRKDPHSWVQSAVITGPIDLRRAAWLNYKAQKSEGLKCRPEWGRLIFDLFSNKRHALAALK